MRAKKFVGLVEARTAFSRSSREVAQGGEATAITQRSKLSAVLVNATRYEAEMAELEQYRRQRRAPAAASFSNMMEIVGDLEEDSHQLTEAYESALLRSGDQLNDALCD